MILPWPVMGPKFRAKPQISFARNTSRLSIGLLSKLETLFEGIQVVVVIPVQDFKVSMVDSSNLIVDVVAVSIILVFIRIRNNQFQQKLASGCAQIPR